MFLPGMFASEFGEFAISRRLFKRPSGHLPNRHGYWLKLLNVMESESLLNWSPALSRALKLQVPYGRLDNESTLLLAISCLYTISKSNCWISIVHRANQLRGSARDISHFSTLWSVWIMNLVFWRYDWSFIPSMTAKASFQVQFHYSYALQG